MLNYPSAICLIFARRGYITPFYGLFSCDQQGKDVVGDSHCDIIMGNDISRVNHCDKTMSNGFAMCISQMYNDVTMNLCNYVLLRLLMIFPFHLLTF